jgi:hypothetical protein
MNIADTIAQILRPDREAQSLLDAIPDTDRHESTLILAHEPWEIMKALVAAGHLQPPPGMLTQNPAGTQLLLRLHKRD